jgi:hypothetical protein
MRFFPKRVTYITRILQNPVHWLLWTGVIIIPLHYDNVPIYSHAIPIYGCVAMVMEGYYDNSCVILLVTSVQQVVIAKLVYTVHVV